MPTYHESIMRKEVLRYLNVHMEGVIVDGTLGDGGHTEFILKNTAPEIRVFAIDRDSSAIERASERLSLFGDRITLVHGSLADLKSLAARYGITCVVGVLMDLGVSSPQLDTPGRGFSIQNDGPTANGITPTAIRHKDQKADQLNRYFEISKKEVFENLQNPKSNRISKPGFTYSEDFINVSPHIGYDSPRMQKDKAALKEK